MYLGLYVTKIKYEHSLSGDVCACVCRPKVQIDF